MSGNGLYVGALVRSDPRLERPDLQMNISAWSTIDRTRDGIISHPFPAFRDQPGASAPRRPRHGAAENPRSAGAAGNPFQLPAQRVRHAGDASRASASPARSCVSRRCRSLWWRRRCPAPSVTTDEQIADDVRKRGVSNLHPVGSCGMGHGPIAVVDPRLRVHGIGGLRVVDASIMPSIIAGNTNAPTIMIAEKASDMILEDAKATLTRRAA